MLSLSSSTTLVNVAEDAELRLVRLLGETAKSSSFAQDCEASIQKADAAQLLKTVLKDTGALNALFVLEPAEEAVSAFSLLTALLTRVGRDKPSEEETLTKQLADAVANIKVDGKDPTELVQRQIALSSVLYNMRSVGKEKCALLAQMITLAGASQPTLLEPGKPLGDILHEDMSSSQLTVAPSSPRLVAMLDAWGVPLKDRRQLFQAAAQAIPSDSPRKQRFLLLFVESYKEEVRRVDRSFNLLITACPFYWNLSRLTVFQTCLLTLLLLQSQVDQQGLDVAKEAALGAVNDPVSLFIHQRNMLSLPAIEALSKNAGKERRELFSFIFY